MQRYEDTLYGILTDHRRRFVIERLESGDGERKTLLTRQVVFEPLPASVLFALVYGLRLLMGWNGLHENRC